MENNIKDSQLQIYQKYIDLIYYANDLVRKYPKSEKFALVQEIKHSLYTGLRLITYAIKAYNVTEKIKFLKQLDTELSLFKVHVRLSYRYKYISSQNYTTFSNHITEICNMLGGWINSCQKK